MHKMYYVYVIGAYSSFVNYRSASNQSQLGEHNGVIVILMSTTYTLAYRVTCSYWARCFSWSWIYDLANNFAVIKLPQNNNYNGIIVNVTRAFAVFCEPLNISFSLC